MSKPDKKSAKQQARRLQQLQRQQQQKRMKQQLQKLEQQQQKLRNTSSPLIQYGLLDAYEYFLKYLAQSGIPQGNVFQFAAQSVLRYQKKIKKKEQQLKKIDEYNRKVIEGDKRIQSVHSNKKKVIKSSMLPFKGEIRQDELNILNKVPKTKNSQSYQQNTYQDQ